MYMRRTGSKMVRAGGAYSRMQKRGFAENPREVEKRIVSTQSIQKITSSMKMVSAAKLRGDQSRLDNGTPFGASFSEILSPTEVEQDKDAEVVEKFQAKSPLYVAITSDRGLCGGVNSYVAKACRLAIDADLEAGLTPKLFIIGDKGIGALTRTHGEQLVGSAEETWKDPMNFAKASAIAQRIAAVEGTDEVRLVYNKFISAIVYDTTQKQVPSFPAIAAANPEAIDFPAPLNKYEMELESPIEAMDNIFEFGLAVQLYGCLIENATSEQSSRMSAMDNASKNAQEMVDSLTIAYNRARQSRITTELIEIISGAESLKG